MTKNQSLLFRVLLFLAGAGIVLLAFFLTKSGRELNKADAFTWISAGVMYLFFFVPFFFSSFTIGNFSFKIPNLALIWTGIVFYILASAALLVMFTGAKVIPFNAAVIIQAALVFLFLLAVYFACFASSHIRAAAAEEAGKQQFINRIKSKAGVLSLSVEKLPAEYENAQKTMRAALEDIRYVYPAAGGAGGELELKIIASLNRLAELCGDITAGAHPLSLAEEAAKLQMLVKERKLLRN
jgi:hypothetical protein